MGPPPALGSKTLSILSLLCVARSLPCLERRNPSMDVFAKVASYKSLDVCYGVTSASQRPGPSPGVPPRSRGRRTSRGPTQRHPSWSRTVATLLPPSSSLIVFLLSVTRWWMRGPGLRWGASTPSPLYGSAPSYSLHDCLALSLPAPAAPARACPGYRSVPP